MVAKDDEKGSTRDTDMSDFDIARVWSATTRRSGTIVEQGRTLTKRHLQELQMMIRVREG